MNKKPAFLEAGRYDYFEILTRSTASGKSRYNNNNDHHKADDQKLIIYTALQHEDVLNANIRTAVYKTKN
jgi:hypothetical protein